MNGALLYVASTLKTKYFLWTCLHIFTKLLYVKVLLRVLKKLLKLRYII